MTDCRYNFTAGGNITSPLFHKKYPTNVNCTWVLQAPVNHTVKLEMKEFHLEKDKKCFYDFMKFFDGRNLTDAFQIGERLCGEPKVPFPINSTGRYLTIQFTSDKSETFRGFRAEWETKEIGMR